LILPNSKLPCLSVTSIFTSEESFVLSRETDAASTGFSEAVTFHLMVIFCCAFAATLMIIKDKAVNRRRYFFIMLVLKYACKLYQHKKQKIINKDGRKCIDLTGCRLSKSLYLF
jgi:hypothetical protein